LLTEVDPKNPFSTQVRVMADNVLQDLDVIGAELPVGRGRFERHPDLHQLAGLGCVHRCNPGPAVHIMLDEPFTAEAT
jgi:hypothetical protein